MTVPRVEDVGILLVGEPNLTRICSKGWHVTSGVNQPIDKKESCLPKSGLVQWISFYMLRYTSRAQGTWPRLAAALQGTEPIFR